MGWSVGLRLASVKFTIRFNATFLLEKDSLSAQRKPNDPTVHRSTDRFQLIWYTNTRAGKISGCICVCDDSTRDFRFRNYLLTFTF